MNLPHQVSIAKCQCKQDQQSLAIALAFKAQAGLRNCFSQHSRSHLCATIRPSFVQSEP